MTATPQAASSDSEGLFAAPEPVISNKRRRQPTPAPVPARAAGQETNDLDAIRAVLATAQHIGYALAGADQRVWRSASRETRQVERVDECEAAVVHQLLRRGLLVRGGHQRIRKGRFESSATSVLVPAATRAMTRRWAAYTRPAIWGQPTTTRPQKGTRP